MSHSILGLPSGSGPDASSQPFSLPIRSALRSTHADGWSRGSSPGSAGIGGSGKTRKPHSPPPAPFSTPPPSCYSRAAWPGSHEFWTGLSAARRLFREQWWNRRSCAGGGEAAREPGRVGSPPDEDGGGKPEAKPVKPRCAPELFSGRPSAGENFSPTCGRTGTAPRRRPAILSPNLLILDGLLP